MNLLYEKAKDLVFIRRTSDNKEFEEYPLIVQPQCVLMTDPANNLVLTSLGDVVTASYALYADSASYANTASYSPYADFALSASYATSMSYATQSTNYQSSASWASQSLSASSVYIGHDQLNQDYYLMYSPSDNGYSHLNGIIDMTYNPATGLMHVADLIVDTYLSATGSLIGSASYAITASKAISASYANTASYTNGTASFASTAGTINFIPSVATTATWASSSISASWASASISASYAKSASYAITASDAITASYALSSSNVLSASYALSSSYTATASVATTATYVSGTPNIIYANITSSSISGLSSGDLNFVVPLMIVPKDGMYQLKISALGGVNGAYASAGTIFFAFSHTDGLFTNYNWAGNDGTLDIETLNLITSISSGPINLSAPSPWTYFAIFETSRVFQATANTQVSYSFTATTPLTSDAGVLYITSSAVLEQLLTW